MTGFLKRRRQLREAVADVDAIVQRDDPYEYWDGDQCGTLDRYRSEARNHYSRLAAEGDPGLIDSLRRDALLYSQDGDEDAARKYLLLASIAEQNAERKAGRKPRIGFLSKLMRR